MKANTAKFEKFLADHFGLDSEEIILNHDWAGTGNTIGALALRLGLLDLDHIDRILDWQDEDKRLFGEIAVELGFMTSDQVDRLISLQRFHHLLEVGEQLVLRQGIAIEEMALALAEFFKQNQTAAPVPTAVAAE